MYSSKGVPRPNEPIPHFIVAFKFKESADFRVRQLTQPSHQTMRFSAKQIDESCRKLLWQASQVNALQTCPIGAQRCIL